MSNDSAATSSTHLTMSTTPSVKLVIYHPDDVSDDLYRSALPLVIDNESRKKIEKFYHRVDACRSLIGRLLIQSTIRDEVRRRRERVGRVGVSTSEEIQLGRTREGKPYILSPRFTPPLPFNVTHDNAVVGIAWCPASPSPSSSSLPTADLDEGKERDVRVGIDVMKVALPRRENLRGFLEMFRDQLTPLEQFSLHLTPPPQKPSSQISPTPTPPTAPAPQPHRPSDPTLLTRFYRIWTLKESYTKALGLGLGFDFKRVEYDLESGVVRVDGRDVGREWRFWEFVMSDGEDEYVGMAARFEECVCVGGERGGGGKEEAQMARVGTIPDQLLETVGARQLLEGQVALHGRTKSQ